MASMKHLPRKRFALGANAAAAMLNIRLPGSRNFAPMRWACRKHND
jgi:hypothetical protein